MSKLLQLVNDYLIPIYRKDGLFSALVTLVVLAALYFFAVYVGIDAIVTEWLTK